MDLESTADSQELDESKFISMSQSTSVSTPQEEVEEFEENERRKKNVWDKKNVFKSTIPSMKAKYLKSVLQKYEERLASKNDENNSVERTIDD